MDFTIIKQHCLNTIEFHRTELGSSLYDLLMWFVEKESYDQIHNVVYELYSHDKCKSLYKELFWEKEACLLLFLYLHYNLDANIKHSLKKYMAILSEKSMEDFQDHFFGFNVPPIINNALLSTNDTKGIKDGIKYLFSELDFIEDNSIMKIRDIVANCLCDEAILTFMDTKTDFEKDISSDMYIVDSYWDAYCYGIQNDVDYWDVESTMDSIISSVCKDFDYIPDIEEVVSEKIKEKAEKKIFPLPLTDEQIDSFYLDEIDIVYNNLKEEGSVDRIVNLFNQYKETHEEGASISELWDELLDSDDLKHMKEIAFERLLLSNLPPEPLHCDAESCLGGYAYDFEGYFVPSILLAVRVFHKIIDDHELSELWPHSIKTYNLFFDV